MWWIEVEFEWLRIWLELVRPVAGKFFELVHSVNSWGLHCLAPNEGVFSEGRMVLISRVDTSTWPLKLFQSPLSRGPSEKQQWNHLDLQFSVRGFLQMNGLVECLWWGTCRTWWIIRIGICSTFCSFLARNISSYELVSSYSLAKKYVL
jgi:hypothetical protein